MYNPSRSDNCASSILDAWIKNIPVLPPSIGLSCKDHLIITDGLHRTNATFCLDEETIPIMVQNHEIVRYGMDLIYELGELEMVIPDLS